ncbi:MAG: helix-turn-helix domain-containing protein [Chloroflexi bacterium]|nr:helix-turn-helix domain-containing protein [Chloroflexota bacterium]
MNKLSTAERAQIIRLLVEGNSIRSINRVTGFAQNTIMKLLVDLGDAATEYQDRAFRNLSSTRIECDEVWAFCHAKAKNVPAKHQGEQGYGDVWTWIAIDPDSKLIPSWIVADDVHGLARLFAPLREEDLLALPRHELVLRMPGPAGRPAVYGGRVCLPPAGDPQQAAALIADSDRRDARPLDAVRAEISGRSAPLQAKADQQLPAKASQQARAQDRQDGQ